MPASTQPNGCTGGAGAHRVGLSTRGAASRLPPLLLQQPGVGVRQAARHGRRGAAAGPWFGAGGGRSRAWPAAPAGGVGCSCIQGGPSRSCICCWDVLHQSALSSACAPISHALPPCCPPLHVGCPQARLSAHRTAWERAALARLRKAADILGRFVFTLFSHGCGLFCIAARSRRYPGHGRARHAAPLHLNGRSRACLVSARARAAASCLGRPLPCSPRCPRRMQPRWPTRG